MLKKIKSCPKRIFALGNIDLLKQNAIAVIGSRNNTAYGAKMTKLITEELVKNDIVIISGLAKGIDSIAHKTCMKNNGKTIAIVGAGFNNIFPKENEKIFYDILKNDGLILSEYPVDYPVQAKNFPRRNRIISGLSIATVVIEATYRSGTSITARFATEQGKKVFCVPNCIGNKNSYGTLNLLKNGAQLVTSGYDILKNLNMNYKKSNEANNKINENTNQKQLDFMDKRCKLIFECIKLNGSVDSDLISYNTNLSISDINQLLTIMEIDGIIEPINGNKYKVCDEAIE